MSTCQNSVTRLLFTSQKATKIQQTIHFPNKFACVPRSTLGMHECALIDENTNYLLPHVYANIISTSNPYKGCDLYGVTITNITSTSFDVTVRRCDKKPWDEILYLDWHAELYNPFNTCTIVGTNINSTMKECEYTLLFPQPLPSNSIGVILQVYSGSVDIEFQVTTRKIDNRNVTCTVRRSSGSTNEWSMPIMIFCRAFHAYLDNMDVKSGFVSVAPNSSGIYVVQQRMTFRTPFQAPQYQQTSVHLFFNVISYNEQDRSKSGIFMVTAKEVSLNHFSVMFKRMDGDDKWNHPIKIFWIAKIPSNPYIPFSGNPPLQNIPLTRQNSGISNSIMQAPSIPTAPAIPPLSTISQGNQHFNTLPSNTKSINISQSNTLPMSVSHPNMQSVNAPLPNTPLRHPQQTSISQLPAVKNFNELIFGLSSLGNIVDKMRLLQNYVNIILQRYTIAEITSILQSFPNGKRDATLLLISTGKVMLTSYDLPKLLQAIPLENEKFDILQSVRQNFSSMKLTCSDARDAIGQLHLPKARYEALEVISPLLIDAKKNGKTLIALFNDKDLQKSAKKLLGLTSIFSIF